MMATGCCAVLAYMRKATHNLHAVLKSEVHAMQIRTNYPNALLIFLAFPGKNTVSSLTRHDCTAASSGMHACACWLAYACD